MTPSPDSTLSDSGSTPAASPVCGALRGIETWQPTCSLPEGHAGAHRWDGPPTTWPLDRLTLTLPGLDGHDERPARPGELCTCGRPARVVFRASRGEVPYCGIPDGGARRTPAGAGDVPILAGRPVVAECSCPMSLRERGEHSLACLHHRASSCPACRSLVAGEVRP